MPSDDERRYTVEEYFELDERSDEKLEYWNGVILPLRSTVAAAEGIFEHAIEGFFRQPGGTWLFTPTEGLDMYLTVRSLGFEVPVREIFAGIELPPSLCKLPA